MQGRFEKSVCIGFLLSVAVLFSGCTTTGPTSNSKNMPENNKVARLENEVQSLKSRVAELEKSTSSTEEADSVVDSEGWKYRASWRKLEENMDYEVVKSILGPAQRIKGGVVAFWYYSNGGSVTFVSGKLNGWEEPNKFE